MGKLIGAMLIVCACGGMGFAIAAGSKREEKELRHFVGALEYMQCELQYRLTPLPDLCRQVALQYPGPLGHVLAGLSDELESQVAPDVSCCMAAALAHYPEGSNKLRAGLELLGRNLGRFDVDGQVRELEVVRKYCRRELEALECNRDSRLRSYQTLGLCAGAALAIILI